MHQLVDSHSPKFWTFLQPKKGNPHRLVAYDVIPSGKVLTERPSFASEIRQTFVGPCGPDIHRHVVVGMQKRGVLLARGSLDVDVVSWMWFLGVMISFRFKMDVDFKLGR